MSLKVTLTITVTNPDSSEQYQAKDSVLTYDHEATPHAIMEKALTFLREEIDSPRLPLEEDEDNPYLEEADGEWDAAEAALPESEPANA